MIGRSEGIPKRMDIVWIFAHSYVATGLCVVAHSEYLVT